MAKNMLIGQIILGRYEILDIIGQGGEGIVGKATDSQAAQTVAVKQLIVPPGAPCFEEALARFKRSAALTICHPNVVDPIDSGQEDSEWYIVMPCIDGPNLEAHLIANGGKLPPDQAVSLIVQIAEALGAAHAQGIIHRDIKPSNVLLDQTGNPYLTDFGICRNLAEQTITTGDGLVGTLQYMSPEQAADARTVDQRSDLYSLGALFYHILTGLPPSQGTTPGSIVRRILQDDPTSPQRLDSSIPVHVDQACMRLLAKHPDARFQAAGEFIQAVQGQSSVGPVQQAYCTSCGMATQLGSRFCHICGAGLGTGTNQRERCLACGAEVAAASACPTCNRSFSPADHQIRFFAGALTGLIYRIPEGIYLVGRDQLAPRDFTISRRHLTIACVNGALFLQDAGSSNKTYVGSTLADSPIQLVPGQEVSVAGNTGTYTCS